MLQVTFTSGDDTETDVDNAEKQSDNSFPIVNISFFKILPVILFLHKKLQM